MALPAHFVNATAITPSDTVPVVDANRPITGIYVGGAGNVTVITEGGQTVTFTAPPVGSILYIRSTHVKATGTTALNLVALY